MHTHSHSRKPQTHDVANDARYKEVRNVTLIGGAIDALLGIVKIVVGFWAHSQALVADGIHSLSDLLTDFLVIFAAKHGSRSADEDHPYGHGRIETVATVVLGLGLVVVAIGIGVDAVDRLFDTSRLMQPGIWALVIATISVLAKEWTYRFTMKAATRLRSEMLRANAWHSRSDAISSIVVVIGVGGALLGMQYLDAIAAVVVALMIAKIGWDLSWHSLEELVDTALASERVKDIRAVIATVPGVRAMHLLRTRKSGGAALADVHIQVQPRLSVSEGHQIGETVRGRLIEEIDELTDVTVHVDPEDDEIDATCDGLPGREEVLTQLFARWEGVLEADDVDQITLHYLSGKVHVDMVLSLNLAAGDAEKARKLSAELVASAERLDSIGKVLVYYR